MSKQEKQQSTGPLQGIRILDLTQFLSGPYATMILGDLGAEIIKVESHQGDSARTIPPYFVGADSAYYLSVNRNKKSVAVDMKQPAGRKIVQDLAQKCDVVIIPDCWQYNCDYCPCWFFNGLCHFSLR